MVGPLGDPGRLSRGRLRAGRLRSREDVVDATVAEFPEVLLRRFRGDNTGRLGLRIG